MLHEILLSLSGHPSSIFDFQAQDGAVTSEAFPLLSPPEAALLSSIGRLSRLHRDIRTHAAKVSSTHPSTIGRAVATAISSTHLARFQQKILDVEAQILKKDAGTVGAYNIVPLAGIVGEFDEWLRPMEWYWFMVEFMCTSQAKSAHHSTDYTIPCSGASIIDKLREEAKTGYPDIEGAALELGRVAETAWLRQVSVWVLYGCLPIYGREDFFVYIDTDREDGLEEFCTNSKLLPKFVSAETASSILFIGKTLSQIRDRGTLSKGEGVHTPIMPDLAFLPIHLQYLSELSCPISSTHLSGAITLIRASISRNALQQLLPVDKILQILNMLQQFFLLGRGEYAVAVTSEADKYIQTRHRRAELQSGSKPAERVKGLIMKEGEVAAILTRTWAALSLYVDDDNDEDTTDESLELARDLVHLSIAKPSSTRPSTPGRAREGKNTLPQLPDVSFNDLLLPVPTSLDMDITSPLDLFLTSAELNIYSAVHSYLLAIRRAHLHLTDLWKQSAMRRDHPAPLGPPQSNVPGGRAILQARRKRAYTRALAMRRVWASCSAAVFLLSETGAFFEGEIVQESWKHFNRWIIGSDSRPDTASRPQSAASVRSRRPDFSASVQSTTNRTEISNITLLEDRTTHDPEALATAHRRFLSALVHHLLLTDVSFTRTLRAFLSRIDELVAFILRLQTIQQNSDLECDERVVDPLADTVREEQEVTLELDRARKRVDSDMKTLVARLREIDSERVGLGHLHVAGSMDEDSYEPWKETGVDRLLMKLDFGSVTGEADDMEKTDYV